MKKLLFFILILSVVGSFGQGENNIWHFGHNAGLDFNSGSPVSIPGAAINQWEGAASVSDASGNLLFYSDGATVWDKTHWAMPNGTGLLGNQSSTQSATIVPVTGNPNQYYLFTCPEIHTTDGLRYSIIDMTLNAGNGDVTATKNVLLLDTCTEQCTVIPATNGCVWFVVRQFNPIFYAYLIDASGINPPVLSYCGSFFDVVEANGLGYMKASPLNNKIGIANYGYSAVVSFFELYDFDNSTGAVSNAIQLTNGSPSGVYGCEFSPDGTKFYGAYWGTNVYQYDLTAGSMAAIQATMIQIGTVGGSVGDMQIGPDQKIYCSVDGNAALSVIDVPNALGAACNFISGAVPLGGATSGIGLPSKVIPSLCNVPPLAAFFAPNHICPGTCTNFINNSTNATSFVWDFPGASPSTSTDVDPQNICYNTPGNYSVSLIATNANGSDTLTLNNFITVYPYPPPQGIMQSGDTLFANAGAVTYQWYYSGNLIPGATDYYYVAMQSGDYNVVATDDNNCPVEAAIFDVIAAVPFTVDGLSFTVYPNPVGNELYVNRYTLYGEAAIRIFNVLGEMILDVQPEARIDVSGLSSGIYILELTSAEKTLRTKFVKQ